MQPKRETDFGAVKGLINRKSNQAKSKKLQVSHIESRDDIQDDMIKRIREINLSSRVSEDEGSLSESVKETLKASKVVGEPEPQIRTVSRAKITEDESPADHRENSCDVNFVAQEAKVLRGEQVHKRNVSGRARLRLATISVEKDGTNAKALLDSGAESNFISPKLVQVWNLETEKVPKVKLTTALQEECHTDEQVTVNLRIGTKCMTIQLYIAEFKYPIMLGYPFVTDYEEEINFGNGTVCGEKTGFTLEQGPRFIDSNQYLRDIRPREAKIGICYVTEEGSDNGLKLPEFVATDYPDVVTNESPTSVPVFKKVTHRILLIAGAKPTARAPYRMSQFETQELKKQIEELLKQGFIKKSNSPFAAPVLFVKKKDKALRLCVDYRLLNVNTIKNAFPIPVIDDLFIKIGNAKVFTKLDLMSGYFQIRMHPDDEEKTAFVTPFGHYEWRVMPFGVVNGPATFQSFMNEILYDVPNVLVYLDDILIYSDTEVDHEHHIRTVLDILRQNKLIVKKKKCEFFKKQLDFLGHTITQEGIIPNDAKIKTIINWPPPKTPKDAMKFMGLCNYYRKFVKGFSKIAAPINEYMAKHCDWMKMQDQAFRTLKEKLTSYPVLVVPNFKLGFRLSTDASDTAIGSTLEQVDEKGKLVGVIGYFSKKLFAAQLNYFVMEKEFLAIIESLKHFRQVLYGRKFVLRSDHLSLSYVMSQGKVPQNRIARWLDFLSEYDFDIQHISGTKNNAADALSRVGVNSLHTTFTAIPFDYDFSRDYETDPQFGLIYDCLKNDKPPPKEINHSIKHYLLNNNWLYYSVNVGMDHVDDRICIPQGDIRTTLIEQAHNPPLQGHFGEYKTYMELASQYYWPKMFKDVRKYVKTCLTCQQTKHLTHLKTPLLQPLPIPEDRWSSVTMDFLTGFPTTADGYDCIMVVVDRFTKRAHFIPTFKKSTSEEITMLFIKEVIRLHGLPREIISDKDIKFMSIFWKTIQDSLGTELKFSTTNHPETDGQTERVNSIVNGLLRRYASNQHTKWVQYLPMVEFAYNRSYQRSIKCTPFMADIGREVDIPNFYTSGEMSETSNRADELATKLRAIFVRTQDFIAEAQLTQERYANKHRTKINYEVGQWILLHRDAYLRKAEPSKLHPIYYGPFRLVAQSNEQAFEVDLPYTSKKHRIMNTRWFRPFNENSEQYPKQPPRTVAETRERARLGEIIGIAGYNPPKEELDVFWEDCEPGHASTITREDFEACVPEISKSSLLNNFTTLTGIEISKRHIDLEDASGRRISKRRRV